jgi:hypothetical protein
MPLIALDDAKAHLRISSDDDDVYLADLIELIEQFVADDLNILIADLADTPAPVRHAVRFLLAHWWENREPVTNGTNVPRGVPLSYDSIIYKYRSKSIL